MIRSIMISVKRDENIMSLVAQEQLFILFLLIGGRWTQLNLMRII